MYIKNSINRNYSMKCCANRGETENKNKEIAFQVFLQFIHTNRGKEIKVYMKAKI